MGCTPSSTGPEVAQVSQPQVQLVAPQGSVYFRPAAQPWTEPRLVPLDSPELRGKPLYELASKVNLTFNLVAPRPAQAASCDPMLDGGFLFLLRFPLYSSEGRELFEQEESRIHDGPGGGGTVHMRDAAAATAAGAVAASERQWDSAVAVDNGRVLDPSTHTRKLTLEDARQRGLWRSVPALNDHTEQLGAPEAGGSTVGLSDTSRATTATTTTTLVHKKRKLAVRDSVSRRWMLHNDTPDLTFRVTCYLGAASRVEALGDCVLSYGPLPQTREEERDYASPVPLRRQANNNNTSNNNNNNPNSDGSGNDGATAAAAGSASSRKYVIVEAVVPPRATVALLEGKVRDGYRFSCCASRQVVAATQEFLEYSRATRTNRSTTAAGAGAANTTAGAEL